MNIHTTGKKLRSILNISSRNNWYCFEKKGYFEAEILLVAEIENKSNIV